MAPTREQLSDLAWRAGWTAVQSAISLVVVGGMLSLDVGTWQLAALAAGAGALSVVKTFASHQLRKAEAA